MVFVKLPWYTQTFANLGIIFFSATTQNSVDFGHLFQNLFISSLANQVSHLILGQENCSVEQVKLIRDLLLDRLKYMYIYSRTLVTLTYSTEPTFFNHFMK